jgi:hypothetical protein
MNHAHDVQNGDVGVQLHESREIIGPFYPSGTGGFFWQLRLFRQHRTWHEVNEFFRRQGATATGLLECNLKGEVRTQQGVVFDDIVLPFEGTLAVFTQGQPDTEAILALLKQLTEALAAEPPR